MDSTFNFSIRRLPNGDALLCDGGGAPIACNAQGRIYVTSDGVPMTVDQYKADIGFAQVQERRKPELAEYHDLVEQILRPRLNLRSRLIEFKGESISDEEFENLNVLMDRRYGLQFRKVDLQSTVRALARKAEYDPVQLYLDGLTSDETGVLSDDDWARIAQIALGATEPKAQKQVQRWLISCVARIYEPGCQVDYALILHGAQGAGKTSFFNILGGEWFTSSLGELKHMKDEYGVLHANWINEWGEVDSVFNGANASERIKRFVSTAVDTFRVPYGRTSHAQKRRSVIVGTTNRDDWAQDPTGNRRFPIISVTDVDLGWLEQNRDKIWATALREYRTGTRWWFTKEEEAAISQEAANYAPEDPNADRMLSTLRAWPLRWFSTHELAAIALQWDDERIDKRSLGSLQRSLHALSTQGVVSERRYHEPANPSHGSAGSKRCWSLPVNSTQPTQ